MPVIFFPKTVLASLLFCLIFFVTLSGKETVLAQDPGFSTKDGASPCQSAKECFQLAVSPTLKLNGASEVFPGAISLLQQVQTRFPETIWARRADLRLGLLLTRTEPEKALKFFDKAASTFSMLEDYLQFWRGAAQLEAREFSQAAAMFEAIRTNHPASLLRSDAIRMGGRAYFLAGDCPSAVRLFLLAPKDQPDSKIAAQALLNLGECQLEMKQPQDARTTLREVWWRFPTEPEAETALTLLEENQLVRKQDPQPEDRYKRAMALFNQASFNEAITELQQFVQAAPASPQYSNAQYKLGLAFARLKQYDQAETVFQQVSTSQSRQAGIATVWLGRVYLRQNDGASLLALQNHPSFKKSSGDQQALISVFYGVWLEDQGKYDEAIQFFRRAAEMGRSPDRRLDALWRVGWRQYQLGQYPLAISTFREMQNVRSWGEEYARASYWMARANDQLKQRTQAQELYQELATELPFTYYGQLANSRLSQPSSSLSTGSEPPAPTSSRSQETIAFLRNKHYQKAEALIGLNLFREAAEELHSLKGGHTWDRQALSQYLTMAQQAHAYDLGIRISIDRFGGELHRGKIPLSSEIWSWAYPKGYLSAIQAGVGPGLDPFLVAGLIREESLYNPFAVSRVGALGLMQLMPSTAAKVARQLGLPALDREELFDPEANIHLGTTYVNSLFKQFKGNIIFTVAAYNAGPPAVNRWIVRNGHQPPDEFVESISYRETRGYVKRVLGSFKVYRSIGEGSCQNHLVDSVC